MQGGGGSDKYIVDNVDDKVVELTGSGTDLIESSVTFTLASFVENLTLTGPDTINGAGNDLNNLITGNGSANKLEGLANSDTLSGGGGADTLDGGLGNDRLIGGLGDDTYVVDSIVDVIVEKSKEGIDTVLSSINFTLDAGNILNHLELTGIFNLNGTGNGNDNRIVGNVGNNILDGGDNAFDVPEGDTLTGGAGDDTYIVHNIEDQVKEVAGEGHDTVKGFIGWKLGAEQEDLLLMGTAIIGIGNELANKLTGNASNNKLDGGIGDDTMIGGAGDDLYVVDSIKDVITDASGTNDEVIFSGKDLSLVKLYTNIEHYNFSLLDPAAGAVNFTGTTAANRITGTALDDTLAGGSGNDTLLGGAGLDSLSGGVGNDLLNGGAGDDTMDGGVGNDIYVIDVATDKIADSGKDTGDTVQTGTPGLHIDLNDLGFFGGVENVTFTGIEDLNATGTAANNLLTGNGGDNALLGLDGNDTLLGGGADDTLTGGKGTDSMAGGTGDDVYLVDVAGDKIVEALDAGDDLVRSVFSYILGDNLDQLVLVGEDLNGTGNKLANVIIGTNGKNILDGKAEQRCPQRPGRR